MYDNVTLKVGYFAANNTSWILFLGSRLSTNSVLNTVENNLTVIDESLAMYWHRGCLYTYTYIYTTARM